MQFGSKLFGDWAVSSAQFLLCFCVCVAVGFATPTGAFGGERVSVEKSLPENEQHLSDLVQSIVREAIPRTFENRKNWGKRKEVFSGVKIRTEGLNVRVSKKKKSVRHGFWRRHTVTLVSPERTLKIRVSNVQPLGGGRWTYTVTADVKANIDAQFEQWSAGIKLLNGSAEGDAVVRLVADCTLNVRLASDPEEGPMIVFAPDIKRVDLFLRNLDVKKFGELRGKAATDLFDGFEDVAEDLLQTQEQAVVRKARKEIAKREDDLRIPLGEFLTSSWSPMLLLQ